MTNLEDLEKPRRHLRTYTAPLTQGNDNMTITYRLPSRKKSTIKIDTQ